MIDLKAPLKDKYNIYGDEGILKQKLNQEYKPGVKQDTRRSVASLKDFQPERINETNRNNKTNRSNEGQPNTLMSQ